MAGRQQAKFRFLRKRYPGLRYLGTEPWYGPGYCGVCGATKALLAYPTRYWDPDDGWKVGVLCVYCTEFIRERGPQPGDYAYRKRWKAEVIDAVASVSDPDGVYSDFG